MKESTATDDNMLLLELFERRADIKLFFANGKIVNGATMQIAKISSSLEMAAYDFESGIQRLQSRGECPRRSLPGTMKRGLLQPVSG